MASVEDYCSKAILSDGFLKIDLDSSVDMNDEQPEVRAGTLEKGKLV